jgi:glycosyltransferase involved in cell wall biosynthesis
MKVSIICWIYNRAHLLQYSLQSLRNQLIGMQVEVNIADDGSTDNLDQVLRDFSYIDGWEIIKYDTSHYKEVFDNRFNCPAAYYNALVAVSSSPYIIKIDPEFVFITNGFVTKGLDFLHGVRPPRPALLMPLPHHVGEFEFNNIEDIQQNWREHEYPTHINRNTAPYSNVYYGCVFNRQAYIDLGGIDLRFGSGIGSEDDHFLDQWRRRYREQNVITLLEEEGLHMWHSGFSAGVPKELYHHVDRNAYLRTALANTYPNNGHFYSIVYPDLPYVEWRAGVKVVESGNKSVNNTVGVREAEDGIIIGHVHGRG